MKKISDLIGADACILEECGQPIAPERVAKNAKFCSRECCQRASYLRRAHKRKVYLTCVADDCDATFVRTSVNRKYCSDLCSKRVHRQHIRAKMAQYGLTSDGRSPQRRAKIHQRRDELIQDAGGKCQECGYDRCSAVLQFHHRDVEDKRFLLSGSNLLRNWDLILAEAAKCDLLCANCHVELHDAALRGRREKVYVA